LVLASGVLLTGGPLAPLRAHAAPPVKQCANGIDDDGDGKIDYPADPGCENLNDNSEVDPVAQCSDTIDNDLDGKIDYPADPGCDSAADNNEADAAPAPQCSDKIDNDADGKIDYPADPGCQSLADNDETNTVVPPPPPPPAAQCANGIDDDGDGKIDFPADPGCASVSDNDEFDAPVAPPPPPPPPVTVVSTPTATPTLTAGSSSTQPALLSPFPVVRLAGRLLSRGVHVTLLTVAAPAGSVVTIRCKGQIGSCPRSTLARTSTGRRLRFRSYQRTMRNGTVLQIYVTKRGYVGKYTRFLVRRQAAPSRVDRCARVSSIPIRCP
jgi:hypothetical protein